MKIKPPFKCHGGKFYLNQWILEHFPQNYESMHYIEPFCGGANILLNKEPSQEEIINDLDGNISLIMRVIRDQVEDFTKNIKKIKYKESTFDAALEKTDFEDEMDKATNDFILRRMSRGGMKKVFSSSVKGEDDACKSIIAQLPKISERLQNVYITNRTAIEILKVFDNNNILAYIDPPELPDKEQTSTCEFEMSIEHHIELSEVLNIFKGKVLISGSPSRLYNRLYKSWTCETKKINHSSQQKIKTELLWRNF